MTGIREVSTLVLSNRHAFQPFKPGMYKSRKDHIRAHVAGLVDGACAIRSLDDSKTSRPEIHRVHRSVILVVIDDQDERLIGGTRLAQSHAEVSQLVAMTRRRPVLGANLAQTDRADWKIAVAERMR